MPRRASTRSTPRPTASRGGWSSSVATAAGSISGDGAGAHLELPVERLRSGNPLEDRELRRRIDARRYPTIAGDLTAMEETGEDGRYRVEGDLTFKGVTRRVRGRDDPRGGDGQMVIRAGERCSTCATSGIEPPRILLLKVEPDVR